MNKRIANLKNRSVAFAKYVLFGHRGEPYNFSGKQLRFPIGGRPVKFNYLHSEDRLAREEATALAFLPAHLREGDVALDVGAHSGKYSALMSSLCGRTGRVISFEPDPAAAQKFENTFALNPDLKRPELLSIACAATTGSTQFFTSSGDARSSLIHGQPEDTETIEVETVSLDDFTTKNNLSPRLIKIDVEGAEVEVLRGATKLLRTNCTFVCELHPLAWPRFSTSFGELLEIVGRANRSVRYLSDTKPTLEGPVYGLTFIE